MMYSLLPVSLAFWHGGTLFYLYGSAVTSVVTYKNVIAATASEANEGS